MIKDLLVRLMEEANEEADHKGWCDEELATNKMSRDDLSAEVESLTAQVDELSAVNAKLGQEIAELGDDIAAIDLATAKATAERKEEKERNTATVEDAKAAQAAVLQAIKILHSFYSQASAEEALLQRQSPSEDLPVSWSQPYRGMQGERTGVVGILEVVRADFARLEAETSSAEDEAERVYDGFMSDSEVDKAVKDKEMRHKGYKRDRTQRALANAKEELDGTQEELTAALEYHDKLKPSCVDSGMTYGERAARRKEEIESLQQALRVLEGEDLSAPAA